ncbi:MAG: tetratricopeptide repeat protein, partial [Paramuribaculum sp.]|nr:tetratricopeptide repeat protein [Paramuribaculum sp.]
MDSITKLIAEGNYDEAIAAISEAIARNNGDDSLYFMRGKLYWKKGKRREAMNDYAEAVRINPDSAAGIALEQAHDVAGFFNPDLL